MRIDAGILFSPIYLADPYSVLIYSLQVSEYPRDFEIIGPIHDVEVIASGRGVYAAARLRARFGGRRWRKLKGFALIRRQNGVVLQAELH